MHKSFTLLLSSVLLLTSNTQAAVTAEEASQLGTVLTPVGAEMTGNSAGTIPAWTGGLTKSTKRYQDPFADEQPLFIITADNAEQHKSNLSAGQIALLHKYPTFQIPVYSSHRTAALPQYVYDQIKNNATQAELATGGNGLIGFSGHIPFPIPQNGLEVIWNHITRYRGGSLKRTYIRAPVHSNGRYTPIKIHEKLSFPSYLKGGAIDKDDNILLYFIQQVIAPTRLTGNVILVHETLNQVQQARQAWAYNSGQRRVRRAPQLGYDGPDAASEGQSTVDNLDLYNGAPDRYDWKLIGKQELYIPYNSFKLADRNLKYKEILQKGHLNPNLTRYELHRVWKVEATLKEGERHIYAKRVFYIDEDTWQIATIDHFDGRGQLWRVAEAFKLQYRDAQVPFLAAEALYDLQSGRYLVSGMTNEEGAGFEFGNTFKHKDFTPHAIRRLGR